MTYIAKLKSKPVPLNSQPVEQYSKNNSSRFSTNISNLNLCLVNIFSKLTQRLIQNNKTVIQIKYQFNAISHAFQTADALIVNTSQNITAPRWPVRQLYCLSVQFHDSTIDCEFIWIETLICKLRIFHIWFI